jgi:hypothetical protein
MHVPVMKKPPSPSLLRLIAVMAPLSLLIGCSEPNTMWAKDGASADDLRAARRDCSSTAAGYSFVDEDRYDGMERNRGSSASSDIYRQCMEGQGWRRQRTDQGPR